MKAEGQDSAGKKRGLGYYVAAVLRDLPLEAGYVLFDIRTEWTLTVLQGLGRHADSVSQEVARDLVVNQLEE